MRIITILSFFIIIFNNSLYSQIMIDGEIGDWDQYPKNNIEDNDINYIKIADDSRYLYILFELSKQVKLNKDENIFLTINIDNDKTTGRSAFGYDFAYDFSHKKGVQYSSQNGNIISVYEMGLHYLPTIKSSIYEVAIRKDSILIETTNEITLSIFNGIKKMEEINPVSYTLKNENQRYKMPKIHKKSWNSLRLMTYNILHDGIIKNGQQEKIMALIKVINPDILTLNECWDATPDTITKLFIHHFPNSNWYATKNDEGNITVSKYPIIKSVNIQKKARITANYIQYKHDTVLVLNVHFRCCDNDKERIAEVSSVLKYIELIKTQSKESVQNYPIIVMGDYNFVGEADQLEILLNGKKEKPDWDNTNLTSLKAYQANSNSSYTWYDEKSDYSPGKLDYIVYTDSKLKPKKSFVVNTTFFPEKYLNKYGFHRDLSKQASDHLPIVVDFKIIKD